MTVPASAADAVARGRSRPSLARQAACYLILPPLLLAAAALLLPLAETRVWWVRMLDFPALQFLVLLACLAAGYLALRRPRTGLAWLPLAAAGAGLAYGAWQLHPYTPLAEVVAAAAAGCPDGVRLRVLIANVQEGNREADRLLGILRDEDPDVFLGMETDAWWDARLAGLRDRMPYAVRHVPRTHGYYGMHLFSRYELIEPRVLLPFDEATPSISTMMRLSGGATILFRGVHPRPPHWSQPATPRDAQLLDAAIEAHASPRPVVLAGDLNAVPWERVVRRTARIGGLLDPRAGRGLYPTFDATRGPLVSWPLDQVLYQGGFALLDFRVLPAFGSDHYPVLAELCLGSPAAAGQAAPAPAPGDLEEARRVIGTAGGSP